jgi:hypothetical protein
MRIACPVCAAALTLSLVAAVRAENGGKSVSTPRVYGPAPPPRRVYGPRPATAASRSAAQPARSTAEERVAARAESARIARPTDTAASAERGTSRAEAGAGDERPRPVTIYFVHGDEKQSIVEFTLSGRGAMASTASVKSPMTFEAQTIEADVDGKMLLRGDVRIRFSNGIRLGAQLVAVTVHRDEGPVEIVVKE